jgi:hypothetical protein
MIGSDDVLACFIAGNVFTWEYVLPFNVMIFDTNRSQRLVPLGDT